MCPDCLWRCVLCNCRLICSVMHMLGHWWLACRVAWCCMLAAVLHTGFSHAQNSHTTWRLHLIMLALDCMDWAVLLCTWTTALSQFSTTMSTGSLFQLDVCLHFLFVSAVPSPKFAISDRIHSFARHVAAVLLHVSVDGKHAVITVTALLQLLYKICCRKSQSI